MEFAFKGVIIRFVLEFRFVRCVLWLLWFWYLFGGGHTSVSLWVLVCAYRDLMRLLFDTRFALRDCEFVTRLKVLCRVVSATGLFCFCVAGCCVYWLCCLLVVLVTSGILRLVGVCLLCIGVLSGDCWCGLLFA